jgi:hypothetical protein
MTPFLTAWVSSAPVARDGSAQWRGSQMKCLHTIALLERIVLPQIVRA